MVCFSYYYEMKVVVYYNSGQTKAIAEDNMSETLDKMTAQGR